jgi:hypothetical protein
MKGRPGIEGVYSMYLADDWAFQGTERVCFAYLRRSKRLGSFTNNVPERQT